MKLAQSIVGKIILILVYALLLSMCSGCTLKDGQQKSIDGTNEQHIEADIEDAGETNDKLTVNGIDKNTTEEVSETVESETVEEESRELQYPFLLTPALTGNIEFAIDSEDIFCIYDGEKYGYLKKDGTEITDYIYDMAFPFSEGLACVMKDGKYGFIDDNGEEVLPCIYEDAAPFREGLAYFATEEEYGFMTKDGTTVFYLDCDSVSSFQEGLAYFSLDGKYGYIDKTGQIVIEPVYSDADYFKAGLAFVEIDGYKGAVNTKGEIVIPVQYDYIYRSGEYIRALRGNVVSPDACEYYSVSGDVVSKEEYENGNISVNMISQDVYDDSVSAETEEYKYERLQEKLEETYDYVSPFYHGLAQVRKGEYFGIVDENGELIVPVEYDFAMLYTDGSYFLRKGKGGVLYNHEQKPVYDVNRADDELFYLTYDISILDNGYMIEDDDKIVVIDKNGRELLSAECDYAAHDIYMDSKNCILREYGTDIQDRILMLEENEEADISDTILKNSITPRIKLYWQLTHGKNVEMVNLDNEVVNVQLFHTWNEYNYIKKTKLHDVSHSGLPILYCYEEPCIGYNFPMSDSALYGISGNQLRCLVRGEECGGSARGDYVCFWRDVQSGEILIGNQGTAGGFGGYAGYSRIYEHEDGKATIVFYYEWIRQSTGNYTELDLYNNAYLFYDDNDMPYTQDSIQEAESVNEYIVKEDRVSIEDYEDARSRYQYFNVY